jgi:hypothetical protein
MQEYIVFVDGEVFTGLVEYDCLKVHIYDLHYGKLRKYTNNDKNQSLSDRIKNNITYWDMITMPQDL